MMKRFALGALLLLSSPLLKAQEVEKGSTKNRTVEKPSRDFVMLQVTHEGWANTPDTVKTTAAGRGFNAYICYDFPIKNSNFSFAAGVGIASSNIYLADQEILLTPDSLVSQATFIRETRTYKKYKLTTAYLEAPFELRYFGNKVNRNRGFKAAIGMKVGTLVGAHTKGKEDGSKVVYKVNTKRFIEPWRFAGTVRVGWGNFSVVGTYNLNHLYKDNEGPQFTPYSVGLCITGL